MATFYRLLYMLVLQYYSKTGFVVTSCMDGYATGAFFLNCAVHWDIKCEWYFVHIDDIVLTNFVFGNLLLNKSTE